MRQKNAAYLQTTRIDAQIIHDTFELLLGVAKGYFEQAVHKRLSTRGNSTGFLFLQVIKL
jgi:hypothetical protein